MNARKHIEIDVGEFSFQIADMHDTLAKCLVSSSYQPSCTILRSIIKVS